MATKIHPLIAEFSARLGNFKRGITQAVQAVDKMRAQTTSAFKQLDAVAQKASSGIRAAYKSIDSDVRKTAGSLQSAVKAVDTAATRMSTVVGGVATVTTFAVGRMGFGFLKLKENATMSFSTIIGSADEAKRLLQDLEKFAATTPFELPGLITSSQKLLAFGVEAQKIIPIMTSIGDAAAGLGGSPELIDRIVLALGQMKTAGRVMGGEMRQLQEAGIPAWESLSKIIGKSVDETRELSENGMIKTELVFDAFVDSIGSRFKGLMNLQSKTLGGMVSTMTDSFRDAAGRVFEPLYRKATEFLTWAQGKGGINLDGVVEKLRAGISRVADAMDKFLRANGEAILRGLADAYVAIADAVAKVIVSLRENATVIKATMQAWFNFGIAVVNWMGEHPRLMTNLVGLKLMLLTGLPQAVGAVLGFFARLAWTVTKLTLLFSFLAKAAGGVFGNGAIQSIAKGVFAFGKMLASVSLLQKAFAFFKGLPMLFASAFGGPLMKITLLAKAVGILTKAFTVFKAVVLSLKMGVIGVFASITAYVIYKLHPAVAALRKEMERAADLTNRLDVANKRRRNVALAEADQGATPEAKRAALEIEKRKEEGALFQHEAQLKAAQASLEKTQANAGMFDEAIIEKAQKDVQIAESILAATQNQLKEIDDRLSALDGKGGGAAPAPGTVDLGIDKLTPEQKASEDREKQVEEAMIRAAERDDESLEGLGDILGFIRDGASPNSAQSMALTFEGATPALASALAMALREGVDPQDAASTFIRGANANVARDSRTKEGAEATQRVRDEFEGELPAQALKGFNDQLGYLQTMFQYNQLTAEEFAKELEAVEAESRRAIESTDAIKEADAGIMDFFKSGVPSQYAEAFETLKQSLMSGSITVGEFKDGVARLSDAAATAHEATKQIGEVIDGVFGQTFPQGSRNMEVLKTQFEALQAALDNGTMTIDAFKNEVADLATEAERAAEAERQRRLLAGDFVGAGLDPQKALLDRLLQARMQQFNNYVDGMYEQAVGIGGMFQGLGDSLREFDGRVQGFAQSLPSGGDVGAAFNRIVDFMNDLEGRKQLALNNLTLMRQNLLLTDDALSRRTMEASIQALVDQLMMLNQLQEDAPSFIGDRGDLDFKDPDTASGKSGGGGGGKGAMPVNLSFPNLTRVSQTEAQVLADTVIREMDRRGRSL